MQTTTETIASFASALRPIEGAPRNYYAYFYAGEARVVLLHDTGSPSLLEVDRGSGEHDYRLPITRDSDRVTRSAFDYDIEWPELTEVYYRTHPDGFGGGPRYVTGIGRVSDRLAGAGREARSAERLTSYLARLAAFPLCFSDSMPIGPLWSVHPSGRWGLECPDKGTLSVRVIDGVDLTDLTEDERGDIEEHAAGLACRYVEYKRPDGTLIDFRDLYPD